MSDKIINDLVNDSFRTKHVGTDFVPGQSAITVTGKYFDQLEIKAAVEACLDFKITAGPRTLQFEKSLGKRIGVKKCHMVNSGSSANLLAVTALTSPKLGERSLKPGDEVLTVAAGFPTTVSPIIQNQLVPVYVDVDLGTYVANGSALEEAIGPKTKAIMMAHTLGNPFDLNLIRRLTDKYNLWLIEDTCDALGGTFNNQNLGTFGDFATLSFYPAHHITTGEGGAVLVKSISHSPIIESIRDWGRDCWCPTGCENTCHKRFEWKLGELPEGYDHKYIYSHLGYNLKSSDIQAAIGIAQLSRLDFFIQQRRKNWAYLTEGLLDLTDHLLLPVPTPGSNPSWFGFALTLLNPDFKSRNELIRFLDQRKIGTRLLFGGNLLKQPAFISTKRRIHGSLKNTDYVMNNTFWVGIWPGISNKMLDYMIESFHDFYRS